MRLAVHPWSWFVRRLLRYALLCWLMPATTLAGGSTSQPPASLCPVPAPGECVYRYEYQAGTTGVATLDSKYLLPMVAILQSMSPTMVTKQVPVLMTDPNNAAAKGVADVIGKSCTLKAICFSMNYQGLNGITWQVDDPVTITVHAETAQAGIPIVLDFRGPKGEQTTLSAKGGTFKTDFAASKPPCGLTFAGSHITAAGFKVAQMPGDGICDVAGVVDLNFSDMTATQNGGDGMVVNSDGATVAESTFTGNAGDGLVVNGDAVQVEAVAANGNGGNGITVRGDNTQLIDVEASYNHQTGIDLLGSNTTIAGATVLNNEQFGIHNHDGTTGNTIDDAVVAGNLAGNIQDDAGSLVVGPNVTENCPAGFVEMNRACKRECPNGQFDFLGDCVAACPAGYAADTIGICRYTNNAALFAIVPSWQLVPANGGCSLTAAAAFESAPLSPRPARTLANLLAITGLVLLATALNRAKFLRDLR
ncbi:MAG: right-handed parallel beta-helix repeat-containing protein [Deltaproteobacteria bacterium]|nr:right-handed parallel beta-helix repeat-containing protein [Deltaproteobacteria bacterium]